MTPRKTRIFKITHRNGSTSFVSGTSATNAKNGLKNVSTVEYYCDAWGESFQAKQEAERGPIPLPIFKEGSVIRVDHGMRAFLATIRVKDAEKVVVFRDRTITLEAFLTEARRYTHKGNGYFVAPQLEVEPSKNLELSL